MLGLQVEVPVEVPKEKKIEIEEDLVTTESKSMNKTQKRKL